MIKKFLFTIEGSINIEKGDPISENEPIYLKQAHNLMTQWIGATTTNQVVIERVEIKATD